MKLISLQSKNLALNTLVKLVIGFCLTISCVASAQQAATIGRPLHSEGEITVFSFGGLTWRMPWRFFQGFRPFTNDPDSKELEIVFGWEKSTDTFPAYDRANYLQLRVQVRNVQDADPRNALALIHRIRLQFDQVPLFAAAKFNGMTYLGSSSIDHYFVLDHGDVYVECSPETPDRLRPPKVAPGILSKKFSCETMLKLPHGEFARVTISYVDLNDVGLALSSVHREILSFIQ
jgi:hypothetical protein